MGFLQGMCAYGGIFAGDVRLRLDFCRGCALAAGIFPGDVRLRWDFCRGCVLAVLRGLLRGLLRVFVAGCVAETAFDVRTLRLQQGLAEDEAKEH